MFIAGFVQRAGIFIPSLAVGGAWGRLVGMLVQACLSHAGSGLRVSLPAYTVRALVANEKCSCTWHRRWSKI
jgi:H+/Cl- antiporter ClcA